MFQEAQVIVRRILQIAVPNAQFSEATIREIAEEVANISEAIDDTVDQKNSPTNNYLRPERG
jgi:hypothetical protein